MLLGDLKVASTVFWFELPSRVESQARSRHCECIDRRESRSNPGAQSLAKTPLLAASSEKSSFMLPSFLNEMILAANAGKRHGFLRQKAD
jgi:hypothetical protein